ncbi:MAG: glycosyltransferase family 39 protein [Armatimonadetes bacterium]|nr:glycosyltransferase family 39 protein [Armatimonadota bacterium]
MRSPSGGLIAKPWDVLAGLAVILGLSLRFTGLAQESLWDDEVWSKAVVTTLALPDMLQRVAQDQHPPLYFLCLSGWAAIFGTSEAALRSLSALFGSLTLPIAWIAMRRATTPQTAALCVVLLAVSPKHLRWSQEVRQYALLGLAVWAMLWCAVKCCYRPSRTLGGSGYLSPRLVCCTRITRGPSSCLPQWVQWAHGRSSLGIAECGWDSPQSFR